MSKVFKKWDIWWAKIPYEEDPTQTTEILKSLE